MLVPKLLAFWGQNSVGNGHLGAIFSIGVFSIMKILIIGNGAREYALGLALSSDSRVAQLYFAPGNGATETLGKNLIASSYDELLNIAQDIAISLVIVGP